MTANPDE